MNKCVNGVKMPMTDEEIAELNAVEVTPTDPLTEMVEAMSQATTLSAMRAAAKNFLSATEVTGT